jgi:hypothetical protein
MPDTASVFSLGLDFMLAKTDGGSIDNVTRRWSGSADPASDHEHALLVVSVM